ncbi:LysM peptidoglycan-binding domain-containing protein [Thermolongibacillus altinsuensis]|jgi:LysM repeat protein|uniref:LysM peptidoglycan-binding domain-containing protein n=1 Tax=Thermolongibacillus altinsuensis TaxID=575256 RepID=UPI00242A2DEA|nr:LysM peptidoglycan-binding domain-containing protein [Thermolongibacillus altinsuensis]GMB07834.1 peptidase M23 [Thermolongibacillus altinsuensis]
MNRREHEDQAEQLRKKMEGIDIDKQGDDRREEEMTLPPRSEVHKKKKTKWKIKHPLVRLLALFFILLPISILSIYYLSDKRPAQIVTIDRSGSYETVDIEKKRTEETKTTPSLPSGEQNENKSEDIVENADEPVEPSFIYHTVQENETLYSIAMKYYENTKGMDLIKEWNNLKSAKLHKGQVLKIPIIDGEK